MNEPPRSATLELMSGRARAVVEPAGSRVRLLVVDGRDLLVAPGDDPLLWGCYPMAPWAGRLDRGRFGHDGEPIEVPVDLPPHAIHGLGVHQVWDRSGDGFDLDLRGLWPLGGRVASRFELTEQALTMQVEVTAGDRSMPVVLGWHPCFRRHLDHDRPVAVGFAPERWWVRGVDGLPTGETAPPPPGPWDDCFDGVGSAPTLTWPGRVTVTLEADTETWVVFDERDHTVCVEPQTAPPDAFNKGGAKILAPGERTALRFTIAWGGPAPEGPA